ncbi:hypothetical protein [Chthonobacter rhizosphaerae]|uniref:hypothetical protein n=1 Tax=Chthonobacter rhizosphaerae TaxID=2735553 RepID=UPI0015EE7F62|nr:hypothetical protein [Chthonobacter rhizosphaerae]
MAWSLAFDPFLPWWALAVLGLIALGLVAFGAVRRIRGALLRGLVFLALLAALADPSLVREERAPLESVVAVVADRSASQDVETRREDTDAAVAAVTDRLRRLPGLDVRVVETQPTSGDGTTLFTDVSRALADVPPDRVAGIIAVTDGEVHDVPEDRAKLGFDAPVHALITGHTDEIDRRMALVSAPKFGLVDSTQTLRVRIDDQGAGAGTRPPATVVIKRDGEELARQQVAPGAEFSVDVEIAHGGPNIFEIETPVIESELSPINNKAVAVVEGIRENLRVLLVSGEPHAGERTWRNLLKSDASVDLVHFTILRPPEKQDGTPINELSLIAFPTRELFATKIDEFDLIIFDRYQRRGVLPLIYFDNIARYVSEGGAVLIAAGPDGESNDSVYDTPLAPTLPARPTGTTVELPFKADVTDIGERHPVTRDLPGSEASPPAWSRWFRLIDAVAERGETIMNGPDDKPLLVLSREGEGRVAMLLSDQVWLWARNFEGGGPHVPLLRRLAHWLMKEPDLEEETLRLRAEAGDLIVERQTLEDAVAPVRVTMPNGEVRETPLTEAEPGLFRAAIDEAPFGLYQATDGERTALAHVGPTDPKEYRSLLSTTALLEPIAEATGGTVQRLKEGAGDDPAIPRVVPQRGGSTFGGAGWLGLDMTDAYEVTGIERTRLFAGFIGLALFLAALGTTWWREGR